MTLADIAQQYGTWRLAGFAACLLTWLLLALLRCPFVLVARVLAAAQHGIDARMTARIADAPAASSTRRSRHV